MPSGRDDLDDIQDMDVESSTTSALDVAADAGKPVDAADANSSIATDEIEADTLSVVRDVVDQREAEPAETASSAEGEEVGQDAGGKPSKVADNENYSDVPFNAHPRFQQLIRERNSLREDAGRYRNVQNYLDANGLSAPEAADGLEIMGLMKTDPTAAWAKLKPMVQNLLVAAGEILPQDLAQRVQKNELTRDGALEISRARASEKALKFRTEFQHTQAQRRGATEVQNSIVSTVDQWEADRRLKDPNFGAKFPRIQEKIAFLHATEGVPDSVDGVKAQLKRAYDAVNKELSAQVPQARSQQRKPAVNMVRGGQVAGNARPEPKSTLDIVRAGRRSA
jgi:hypothetical protein